MNVTWRMQQAYRPAGWLTLAATGCQKETAIQRLQQLDFTACCLSTVCDMSCQPSCAEADARQGMAQFRVIHSFIHSALIDAGNPLAHSS